MVPTMEGLDLVGDRLGRGQGDCPCSWMGKLRHRLCLKSQQQRKEGNPEALLRAPHSFFYKDVL